MKYGQELNEVLIQPDNLWLFWNPTVNIYSHFLPQKLCEIGEKFFWGESL